jgi:TRAP-type mannitol/chloroaromatic compound transport system permease large subunit
MDPFTATLLAISALALLGLPIGLSMICGSIIWLYMRGQDMGLVAERLLNSMFTGYVILAVPLFILAAEIMNMGTMTDRLLRFCNALVGGSAAGSPMSTSSSRSSSRACRARHSPTPPAPAGSSPT